MRIIRFAKERESEWNSFLKTAKNQTFLFDRRYMDYHSDRFTDHSLMIYEDKKLIGLFPANEVGDTIISHQGLTYGSVIIKEDTKLPKVIGIFSSILRYYNENEKFKILYKALPRIYNKFPSDEIDYALFIAGAELSRRDIALVIDKRNSIKYSGNIRREAKKAQESGYKIVEERNAQRFWNEILIPNLLIRFGKTPVHSASEMEILMDTFCDEIKIYIVENKDGSPVAGTVFYLTDIVAHCQYIASNDEGRNSGALNFLFTTLIDHYFVDKVFFDFGTTNENEGRNINRGLLGWKERMGGRSVSHDFYVLETSNYYKLENVLI